MGRSSSVSSWTCTLVLLLAALASSVTSAHRKDEYLQAARLGIDLDRVEMTLDLTPGIAVAQTILGQIDGNRDGAISVAESRDYSARLLRDIALDVDGASLTLHIVDSVYPAVDAMMRGEGTIRIRAFARLPTLSPGPHHLHYRNAHRPEIGAYLANALVPTSDRVRITTQRRDADQRDLVIEYTLRADATTRLHRWLAGAILVGVITFAAIRRRR